MRGGVGKSPNQLQSWSPRPIPPGLWGPSLHNDQFCNNIVFREKAAFGKWYLCRLGTCHGAAMIVVSIPSFRRVNDSFVVYSILVLKPGGQNVVERRYREFDKLHKEIKKVMNNAPELPPKRPSIKSKSSKFLESRRQGLESYLQEIVQSCNLNEPEVNYLLSGFLETIFPALSGIQKASSTEELDGYLEEGSKPTHQNVVCFTCDPFEKDVFHNAIPDIVTEGVLSGLYGDDGSAKWLWEVDGRPIQTDLRKQWNTTLNDGFTCDGLTGHAPLHEQCFQMEGIATNVLEEQQLGSPGLGRRGGMGRGDGWHFRPVIGSTASESVLCLRLLWTRGRLGWLVFVLLSSLQSVW